MERRHSPARLATVNSNQEFLAEVEIGLQFSPGGEAHSVVHKDPPTFAAKREWEMGGADGG